MMLRSYALPPEGNIENHKNISCFDVQGCIDMAGWVISMLLHRMFL